MRLAYAVSAGMALSLITFSPGQASNRDDNVEEKVVIAEGAGLTKESATQDALRAAVRQAVGVLVDAETVVENDRVISDKVLTFSGGIVNGYDEIDVRAEGGLVRVKIKARVGLKQLAKRLGDANISIKLVDGKNLAAGVMSKVEARQNAATLLAKRFADLPKTLKAEVATVRPEDYDEDDHSLTLHVTIRRDSERYLQFLEETKPILENVALKSEFRILEAANSYSDPTLSHLRIIDNKNREFWNPNLDRWQKAWCLWMLSRADALAVRSRWECYALDCDLNEVFKPLRGELQLHIEVIDADKKVLAETVVPASDLDRYSSLNLAGDMTTWLGIFQNAGSSPRRLAVLSTWNEFDRDDRWNCYISPFPMGGRGLGRLVYWDLSTYKIPFRIRIEQLNQLRSVRCTIRLKSANELPGR